MRTTLHFDKSAYSKAFNEYCSKDLYLWKTQIISSLYAILITLVPFIAIDIAVLFSKVSSLPIIAIPLLCLLLLAFCFYSFKLIRASWYYFYLQKYNHRVLKSTIELIEGGSPYELEVTEQGIKCINKYGAIDFTNWSEYSGYTLHNDFVALSNKSSLVAGNIFPKQCLDNSEYEELITYIKQKVFNSNKTTQ